MFLSRTVGWRHVSECHMQAAARWTVQGGMGVVAID